MGWIRAHPYASALAIAGILIIAGMILVVQRSPVAPITSTVAWSGGIPIASYTPNATPQQIVQQVIQNPLPSNVIVSLPSGTTSAAAPASEPFDYATLIAQLSAASKPKSGATASTSTNTLLAQAYAFIPTGLVATTTVTPKPMTPQQLALYNYANEVGSTIQSFETEHPGQAAILRDQAADRTDPTKAAALAALGASLTKVGVTLAAMDDVPSSIASYHAALAQSYQDIGAKLQLVSKAQSDADFVSAIETYDKSADVYTKNYVAVAQYLSASGVTFSPQDPGSAFSFTDASSL